MYSSNSNMLDMEVDADTTAVTGASESQKSLTERLFQDEVVPAEEKALREMTVWTPPSSELLQTDWLQNGGEDVDLSARLLTKVLLFYKQQTGWSKERLVLTENAKCKIIGVKLGGPYLPPGVKLRYKHVLVLQLNNGIVFARRMTDDTVFLKVDARNEREMVAYLRHSNELSHKDLNSALIELTFTQMSKRSVDETITEKLRHFCSDKVKTPFRRGASWRQVYTESLQTLTKSKLNGIGFSHSQQRETVMSGVGEGKKQIHGDSKFFNWSMDLADLRLLVWNTIEVSQLFAMYLHLCEYCSLRGSMIVELYLMQFALCIAMRLVHAENTQTAIGDDMDATDDFDVDCDSGSVDAYQSESESVAGSSVDAAIVAEDSSGNSHISGSAPPADIPPLEPIPQHLRRYSKTPVPLKRTKHLAIAKAKVTAVASDSSSTVPNEMPESQIIVAMELCEERTKISGENIGESDEKQQLEEMKIGDLSLDLGSKTESATSDDSDLFSDSRECSVALSVAETVAECNSRDQTPEWNLDDSMVATVADDMFSDARADESRCNSMESAIEMAHLKIDADLYDWNSSESANGWVQRVVHNHVYQLCHGYGQWDYFSLNFLYWFICFDLRSANALRKPKSEAKRESVTSSSSSAKTVVSMNSDKLQRSTRLRKLALLFTAATMRTTGFEALSDRRFHTDKIREHIKTDAQLLTYSIYGKLKSIELVLGLLPKTAPSELKSPGLGRRKRQTEEQLEVAMRRLLIWNFVRLAQYFGRHWESLKVEEYMQTKAFSKMTVDIINRLAPEYYAEFKTFEKSLEFEHVGEEFKDAFETAANVEEEDVEFADAPYVTSATKRALKRSGIILGDDSADGWSSASSSSLPHRKNLSFEPTESSSQSSSSSSSSESEAVASGFVLEKVAGKPVRRSLRQKRKRFRKEKGERKLRENEIGSGNSLPLATVRDLAASNPRLVTASALSNSDGSDSEYDVNEDLPLWKSPKKRSAVKRKSTHLTSAKANGSGTGQSQRSHGSGESSIVHFRSRKRKRDTDAKTSALRKKRRVQSSTVGKRLKRKRAPNFDMVTPSFHRTAIGSSVHSSKRSVLRKKRTPAFGRVTPKLGASDLLTPVSAMHGIGKREVATKKASERKRSIESVATSGDSMRKKKRISEMTAKRKRRRVVTHSAFGSALVGDRLSMEDSSDDNCSTQFRRREASERSVAADGNRSDSSGIPLFGPQSDDARHGEGTAVLSFETGIESTAPCRSKQSATWSSQLEEETDASVAVTPLNASESLMHSQSVAATVHSSAHLPRPLFSSLSFSPTPSENNRKQ